MAMGNALDPDDDGGSRRTSLSIPKGRYYLKNNDYDGLHRSGSTRSANYGSGTSSHRNKTRQNGVDLDRASTEYYRPSGISGNHTGLYRSHSNPHASRDLRTQSYQKGFQNDTSQSGSSNGNGDNIRGRGPRSHDPYSLAAQIMFLPHEMPEEGLRAWGSHQQNMESEGYHHPVLVLTDPDEDGYVVVQKMTSFRGNTLAEQFPDPRDAERRASYMQINNDEKPDEDAGAILYLSPQDDYLRKRSYVETKVSYKCKKDILLPYHYENHYLSNKKYFLRSDSYWKVLDRVLLLRVEGEGNGPKRGRAGAFGSKRLNRKPKKSFGISNNNSCASLPFKDTPSTSLVSLPRATTVPYVPRKNTVPGAPPETPPSSPTRASRKNPRAPLPPQRTPKRIIIDVAKSVGGIGSALLKKTPRKKSKKVPEAETREEANGEEK